MSFIGLDSSRDDPNLTTAAGSQLYRPGLLGLSPVPGATAPRLEGVTGCFSYIQDVCSVFIFMVFSYFWEIETNLVRCKSVIHIAFSLNYLVMSTVLNFYVGLNPLACSVDPLDTEKTHQCDYDPCASGSRHGKKENWRGKLQVVTVVF